MSARNSLNLGLNSLPPLLIVPFHFSFSPPHSTCRKCFFYFWLPKMHLIETFLVTYAQWKWPYAVDLSSKKILNIRRKERKPVNPPLICPVNVEYNSVLHLMSLFLGDLHPRISHVSNSLKRLQGIGTWANQHAQMTTVFNAGWPTQLFCGPRQSLADRRHGFWDHFRLDGGRLCSSSNWHWLPGLWLDGILWWWWRCLTTFLDSVSNRRRNILGLGRDRSQHITIRCSARLPNLWLPCQAPRSWRTQSWHIQWQKITLAQLWRSALLNKNCSCTVQYLQQATMTETHSNIYIHYLSLIDKHKSNQLISTQWKNLKKCGLLLSLNEPHFKHPNKKVIC